MSAPKLIRYFSSHPAAFGFRASTPPNNISLNSANRKVDQSLSDFQTGLGATAHATLDTEQLISHLQVALVDTLSSLPEADRDVIPVSEVRELLLQIHGILDKAVSKRVGNSAHILAHLFNSVSRQCWEVWASQFPFLHSLKEVVPPSEACLYGRINWSLAQAHSVGLSQSFLPKRGGKARPQTGFQFTVQKRPVSGSVPGTSGDHFRLVCFSNFWINGEALHPTGLCLIWFRATIFSLDPILPCSVTFSTLMSRCLQLIILLFRRRLMSSLLREQQIPPQVVLVSILVYLWYLSILGASDPYSILSVLIVICTFLLLRCQLFKLYGSLSSRVIMPFPLIFRMLIYMFPLLSIIASFYVLFGIMCLISGGFYLLDLPQPLGFSHPSLNRFCSFAVAKVCILSSIWMISWSLFTLSGQVKGHACFCVPCWSILVYISIFPSQTFTSLSLLPFWGCVGILFTCWYLYLLIS